MAFPEDPLGTKVEFQIGGTWTDVTEHAQLKDIITHTRGRTGEGQQTDPASCSLTLRSPDGLYAPRNPRSPYYGLIGRNTPMRVSVAAGSPYLALPGGTTRATTPHTGALGITGDIDIRLEATLEDWAPATETELCGKWEDSTRGWMLSHQGGNLRLWWSATGATSLFATSTAKLGAAPFSRLAVRATLDVNNGASGRTVTFYTAPTMAGPWTQLGDPVVQAGTTAINLSTANLDIGAVWTITFADPVGRVYKAEVRNGIDGTVVANPDFTVQTLGATAFTDSAGRPWTLVGGASISNRRTRFVGEYSDWPQSWGRTGALVLVEGEGAGLLRRLNQGKKALRSTLRRRVPSYDPVAYWPMEEGPDATSIYSPIAGVRPFTPKAFTMAGDDTLMGSDPVPVLQAGASFTATVPASTAGTWQVELVYRLDAVPVAKTTFFEVLTTGAARRVVASVGDGAVWLEGYDPDGAQVFTRNGTPIEFTGIWNRVQIKAVVSGGTTTYVLVWYAVGSGGYAITTATSLAPGYVTSVRSSFGTGLDGMAFGHLSVFAREINAAYSEADDGFNGETAGARLRRLSAEEGILVSINGVDANTAMMGPQRSATLLEQMEQCEAADGGLLIEDRERLGLRYRPRASQYNQRPALVLAYGARGLGELQPVEDDAALRNDVTVDRIGGSTGRAELLTGPLSVEDPPAGVGRYDDSVQLNLYSDEQPAAMAHWLMRLGTVDEARYPVVTIRLHRAPHLIDAVLGLTEGDMIRITDLPDWLPPGPVDLLVQGYTERIGVRTWEIDLVCASASPWLVGVADDPVLGRADADEGGSTLALASSGTDAQLLVHTPAPGVAGALPWITSAGPAPTYPSEFPFDVRFGGETARVTACVPSAYDAFGRTVSGGWGVADCGFTWAVSQGAASDRSVTGGAGVVTLASAPDTTRFQRLVSGLGDAEVLVRMSVSQLATGAGFIPGVLLRYVDDANFYRARVHFNPGGTMTAAVTRDFSAVGSTPTLPWTYTAGAWFWVRARVTGHLVQMRVWPDAQREPTVWHKEAAITSSPIPVGQTGVTASSFAGNTNTNPALRFDDFQVVTPQLLTVERSLNGVVKAHAAGTALSLATPAYVAL
ncbi:hypothetical protein KVH27_19620 [Streptomyces olivaceus]|uniref:hypothetical protein n=1 Tax=Streptomyces olivaceus TaxID=47716 RepID=UPI001CCDC8EE|nr:hypothetical protein [Streptomyces olivaceus]MBZ6250578.1 hypothetical protein [Streptomyces olivaceus]